MQSPSRPSTPQTSRLASGAATPQLQNGNNGSSSDRKAPSTPTSTQPPSRPTPGSWQHPRIQEINKRIAASSFTDQNFRRVLYNVLGELLLLGSHRASSTFMETYLSAYTSLLARAHILLAVLFLYNILYALLPLVRTTDQLDDIPLTPAQRKLLGLSPSSLPPTPGSTYSTPTRYRVTSTPLSRSPLSRESSRDDILAGSPSTAAAASTGRNGSARNSPAGTSASPLLHKAVRGERERSNSSGGGRGSRHGNGLEGGAVEGMLANGSSPSPSPLSRIQAGAGGGGGGRLSSSLGLSQKWMYERRRSSAGRLFS